jgi:hypothetical protein
MSNIPWKQAIIQVLQEAGSALRYTDIADEIVKRKLRTDLGATPARTVNVNITSSINGEGLSSPFVRVDRGVYALRALVQSLPTSPSVGLPAAPDVDVPTEEEPAGLIHAFGMYWRRELVMWSASTPLLGQQQTGTSIVDFAAQRGVYLLHDSREVVYVGRASDQPLGKRLFQHTTDRLNSRWDRFSWFGVRTVSEDGKQLEDPGLNGLSLEVVIATLEALLIEGLEPRQNRKRGDDFSAVEYLQYEDPKIKKQRLQRMLQEL